MEIRTGEVTHQAVILLLEDHHQDMLKHSPQKSVHALALSTLPQKDVIPTLLNYYAQQNHKLNGIGITTEL